MPSMDPSNRVVAVGTWIICGLWPVALAIAQDSPGPGGYAGALEEIVVTANKREEKLSTVAGSISVETGEELAAMNANGLRDYVGNLPNVSLQTNGAPGFGKVIIRGISSVTLGATTGTYIDDVPVGSSTMFAAGGFLTPDLDPADLDRVEVLKGPQGTLYGASAPGGLLKFVTRQPDAAAFTAGVSADVLSVDEGETGYVLRGHLNTPVAKDRAAFRVSGFYRDEPGFIDNAETGAEDVNGGTSTGFNASLLITPSDALSIHLGGLAQDLEVDGLNAVAVDRETLEPANGDYDGLFVLPQSNKAETRLFFATVRYDLTPSLSLVSATSYSELSNKNRVDLTPDAPPGILVYNKFNVETEKFSQEFRLTSAAGGGFEWLLGAFYTDESSKRNTRFEATLPDGELDPSFPLFLESLADTDYEEFALFGNATYYLTKDVDLTVGARFAHNRQSILERDRGLLGNPDDPGTFVTSASGEPEDDVDTYSAAMRWRLSDDTMVYARIASGYRPGGPRSLPAGVTPPPGFDDSFDAEELWNYEIGTRTTLLDQRLSLSASLYYIDWQRIQGFIQIGPLGAFGNAGDAVSKGVELEATGYIGAGFSVTGAVGYSHATLTDADPTFGAEEGDTLPYAPRWTTSVNAEYERSIGQGGWSGFVGVNFRHVSEQFTSYESLAYTSPRQAVPLDPYGVLDLRVGARSDRSGITLFVKNLTNEYAYIADTTGTFNGPAFESVVQPRTVGVSINRSF